MKTVIVLGIRSGTSLVAGMLNDLGVYMGAEFQIPDPTNAKGYYENVEILKVMEREILNGERFHMRGPVVESRLEHLESLKNALDKHKREPIWGFKAPGACFAIKAIELFVENPHYILCTRDASEMAQSLAAEKQHSLGNSFNHTNYVNFFMHTMKEQTRHKQALEVDYNSMLQSPEQELYNIVQFLGLEVEENDRARIAKRVDPTLKHYFSNKPVYKGISTFARDD